MARGRSRGGRELPTVTMQIERRYFAAIVAEPRQKDIEYRDWSDFWESRLSEVGDGPFILRLLNGMIAPIPEAFVVVTQLERDRNERELRFHLGEVIELKNWDLKTEKPV